MTIKPKNRQLLFALCDDPRRHGTIIIEGQAGLGFGVVLAVDETVSPHVAEVGNVIYFRPETVSQVVVDNNEMYGLVHESQVVAVCDDVKVEPKKTLAKPKTSKPAPLVVPQTSLIN